MGRATHTRRIFTHHVREPVQVPTSDGQDSCEQSEKEKLPVSPVHAQCSGHDARTQGKEESQQRNGKATIDMSSSGQSVDESAEDIQEREEPPQEKGREQTQGNVETGYVGFLLLSKRENGTTR